MSILEYHVLLALASGPLHGYAVKDTVAADSRGAHTPRAGTLYRVIARLIADGLVREERDPGEATSHPGHERRYYGLTTHGRRTLAAEAERLRKTAAVAARRLGPVEGH